MSSLQKWATKLSKRDECPNVCGRICVGLDLFGLDFLLLFHRWNHEVLVNTFKNRQIMNQKEDKV